MQRKLSRALRAELQHSLGDEVAQVQVVVHEQATATTEASMGALVTTHTRFIHVADKGAQVWGLREVGLQQKAKRGIPGKPVSLSVLANDEMLPLRRSPTRCQIEPVLGLAKALGRQADEPPWPPHRDHALVEAKSLWPYANKGRWRAAPPCSSPARGSLGVGRRGVSFSPTDAIEPILQLPWTEITDLFVAGRDDLGLPITEDRLKDLGSCSGPWTPRVVSAS